MARRNFTRNQKEAIRARAKNAAGVICCEGCGLVLDKKAHEIDHIIAEALRPAADKARKLTIAEGQLLGKACCHRGEDGKTNQDVKKIAEAKRRADAYEAPKKAKQPIPSRPKAERVSTKRHLGPKAIYIPEPGRGFQSSRKESL